MILYITNILIHYQRIHTRLMVYTCPQIFTTLLSRRRGIQVPASGQRGVFFNIMDVNYLQTSVKIVDLVRANIYVC